MLIERDFDCASAPFIPSGDLAVMEFHATAGAMLMTMFPIGSLIALSHPVTGDAVSGFLVYAEQTICEHGHEAVEVCLDRSSFRLGADHVPS